MNLKTFHNQTTNPLVITVTVGNGLASATTEVIHQFPLAPGEQSRLEYGSLQCCFINAISLGYTHGNVHYLNALKTTGPSELSRMLNEGSYLNIVSVEPLKFESDL